MSALSRFLRTLTLPLVAGLVATGIGAAAPNVPRAGLQNPLVPRPVAMPGACSVG